jgi:hypothetical protein
MPWCFSPEAVHFIGLSSPGAEAKFMRAAATNPKPHAASFHQSTSRSRSALCRRMVSVLTKPLSGGPRRIRMPGAWSRTSVAGLVDYCGASRPFGLKGGAVTSGSLSWVGGRFRSESGVGRGRREGRPNSAQSSSDSPGKKRRLFRNEVVMTEL